MHPSNEWLQHQLHKLLVIFTDEYGEKRTIIPVWEYIVTQQGFTILLR